MHRDHSRTPIDAHGILAALSKAGVNAGDRSRVGDNVDVFLTIRNGFVTAWTVDGRPSNTDRHAG